MIITIKTKVHGQKNHDKKQEKNIVTKKQGKRP
jgi:hypothetical protein